MINRKKKQEGFSLIELLVVVAVILIIVAIATPKLVAARKAGQSSAAAGTMRSWFSAEETYSSKYNNGYAATAAQLETPGNTCDTSGMFPAPAGGAALSWHVNAYTFTYVPGTANAAPATNCTAAGTIGYTFAAVPDDATLDGYFLDDTGTIRHGVGTATVASAPLGQ